MKISTPEKDAEKIIKLYKEAKTPDDFDKIFDKVYPKYITAYQEAYEKGKISGAEKDEFLRAVDKELSVVTMTELAAFISYIKMANWSGSMLLH